MKIEGYYRSHKETGIEYKKSFLVNRCVFFFWLIAVIIRELFYHIFSVQSWILILSLTTALGSIAYVWDKKSFRKKLVSNAIHNHKTRYFRPKESSGLERNILLAMALFFLFRSLIDVMGNSIPKYYPEDYSTWFLPLLVGLFISIVATTYFKYRYICKLEKESGQLIMFYYGNYNLPSVEGELVESGGELIE